MDCGCGGGSDCITKHKKDFKKWMKAEMKRLDCGCGCKGTKKFEEKYGKLVGGKLKDCPPGWRNDGLTCVKNCEPGEKDDGLTCRKPCGPGFIDDGLTCRKPITSSMNDCPQGSKDIWGTCWGPVRRDCIDDCFKHPAPGCKTTQCGRLEWAGIDWGPKLCTSCNLRCGQTCWDVWGITKQLHERELKVSGGEVEPKSIYSKEIRGRIDFEATNKEIEQAFIDAFGNDSGLAKAFDPEKNGVADAFRKFGVNTKEAFDQIGRDLKEGFKKSMTPEFRAWWEARERHSGRAFNRFKEVWGHRLGPLNNPEIWIDLAILFAEVAGVMIATGIAVATFGAGTAASAAMVMAIGMIGPSVRMIVKASKGEKIDAFDVIELMLAAVPGPTKGDKAAAALLGQMFQFVQRNKTTIGYGVNILLAGVRFGQFMGQFPSTCIANCPEYDDSPMPPPDNPNPAYIPPMDPPPPGQKTDAELLAMAPGHKPFVKFLSDSDAVNPDYVGTTIKWIKKKRQELYNWPTPAETVTAPEGNLETPEDAKIGDVTTVEPDETQQNIDFDLDENVGFGRYSGGADFIIEPEIVGNEVLNPGGETIEKPPSGKEPPKGPGGCDFNVKCYAQNYPDLFNLLNRNEELMSAYWTDVGKDQGHNPCCGAKLEQGKNYDEDHVKCNARNSFYDRKTKKCDTTRNTKGIRKTREQFVADRCTAEGNYWDKGYEIYVTEERTKPDFFTGKYEIRRTEHTRPTGNPNCDPSRNLQGKNKVEEAAKQQAEANKRNIDRIVKDDFFPACYAANNPDVVAKVGNTDEVLEKHFREYGINEQRSSKCDATLQEQKVAANKAKALEGFNAYCYAYNNPKVFEEISKPFFASPPGQRPQPSVLAEALKKHFMDFGYAQKLDYSCTPRDTEYNWRCFSENMRTIVAPGQLNFDNEGNVNRYWNLQKDASWETFDKGSCRDRDLSKSQKVRDFNAKCYAYNNPELIGKFGKNDSAYLEHYRSEGFDQGLDTSCDARNGAFKAECYGFANPDLNQDLGALTNHWNSSGKNEWRSINCTPEQAENVFQKYYCQDTESFWDGTNCDFTRHTNGRPKEEISKEIEDAYFNRFPEAQRAEQRILARARIEIDVRNYNNEAVREICKKGNNYFLPEDPLTGRTEAECDVHRTYVDGREKKYICHNENIYYDEITRLCDGTKYPSGEKKPTTEEIEMKLAEEEDRKEREEINRIMEERKKNDEERGIADDIRRKQLQTNPELKQFIEDCEKNQYGYSGQRYYDIPSRECVTLTDEHKKCIREGGEYKVNFGTGLEKECIPAGGYTQVQLTEQERQAEIDKRILEARKKFMTEQYELTAKIPGIKPNMYGTREQTIDSCASSHITRARGKDTRTIIKRGRTSGGMIECDPFTPENDSVFDALKAEEARIINEFSIPPPRPVAPVAPLQPVEPEPGPGGLFDGDELEGWGKPASLTLYWARWCPHCHDIIPMWKKLGFNYKGIQIDSLEEQETDFQVDGYPTIIFRNGSNMEKYNGKRTKAAILKFLKNKLS